MNLIDELNKPYSPELKQAINTIVKSHVQYVNDTLDMQNKLNQYLQAIKADYLKWEGFGPLTETQVRMYKEFCDKLHVVETPLYFRIMSNGCHSFIVKADGPKFKRGDILKSAGYNTPAKNQARGNIFGTYKVRWTGAEYLR